MLHVAVFYAIVGLEKYESGISEDPNGYPMKDVVLYVYFRHDDVHIYNGYRYIRQLSSE